MNVQFIAITRSDGRLAIMQYVLSDDHGMLREPPDDVQLQAEFERSGLLDVVAFRRISLDEHPTRRDFRAAWVDSGKGAIQHDIVRAREIQRDRVRAERTPRLEDLDMQSLKALENGEPVDDIKSQKQRLRDAPADPRIDAATSLDEIAALTLDVLLASGDRKVVERGHRSAPVVKK